MIRVSTKRPDAESILKILTSNSATYITFQDSWGQIQFLISTSRIDSRQKKQSLALFFVIVTQSDPESEVYDILKTPNSAGDTQTRQRSR